MTRPPTPPDDLADALAVFQSGDLVRARDLCVQILSRQPDHDRAIFLIGLIAHRQGDNPTALEWMSRAVAAKPAVAGYHANLAAIFNLLARHDDAIAAAGEALRLVPHYADALVNLGNALLAKGMNQEAVTIYRQVVTGIPPTSPTAPLARNNLARALHINGQIDEAIALLAQTLGLGPTVPEFRVNLANALKDQGRIEEAIVQYSAAATAAPDNAGIGSALLYALWFDPSLAQEAIIEEHRRWSRRHADPLRDRRSHENDRDPELRLRIAYLSPDLRQNVIGYLLEPILAHHDHQRFEIVCYSTTPTPDALTKKLTSHADIWRDVGQLTDEALAEQIRADGIDILVDTASHMAGNRLLVFARKLAPVQVTWLGYPATSGLTAMDYRITCDLLEPDDGNDAVRSAGERLIRIPHTFWCYGPSPTGPEVNALPAASGKTFTFGSLNAYGKVNADVVALWAEVLRAVPGAKLMLLIAGGAEGNRSVAARFERLGVTPDRLRFVGYQPRDAYLALFHQIDLALDPFPYNGHTTSLDSLWMGVPFVTLAGNTGISRAGVCMLSNVGLSELIATDKKRYIDLCVELAGDLPRLAAMRKDLRDRMRTSPLTDAVAFTRNLESAYRRMWQESP